MPSFNLQSTIDNKNLIDYSLFSIIDNTATSTLVNLSELEASTKLINFKLRTIGWTGYAKNSVIGYKGTVGIDGEGLTENDAYIIWIEEFKDKEKRFKKLFPLSAMTQSQYDAMLSLYADTGKFDQVGTSVRKFRLLEFINDKKWNYIATAFTLSGSDRLSRQTDAKIMMLGDYGTNKDRTLIAEQSIQSLVKEYSSNQLNAIQKKQAEYVYYAETNRFLPNMIESRKRILANLLS